MESEPTPVQVADVLEKAANLYRSEEVHWCQRRWLDIRATELSMCAEGALMKAAEVEREDILNYQVLGPLQVDPGDPAWRLFVAARGALNKVITDVPGRSHLVAWNDDRDRVAEEVVDLFEATAKDLRNTS